MTRSRSHRAPSGAPSPRGGATEGSVQPQAPPWPDATGAAGAAHEGAVPAARETDVAEAFVGQAPATQTPDQAGEWWEEDGQPPERCPEEDRRPVQSQSGVQATPAAGRPVPLGEVLPELADELDEKARWSVYDQAMRSAELEYETALERATARLASACSGAYLEHKQACDYAQARRAGAHRDAMLAHAAVRNDQ